MDLIEGRGVEWDCTDLEGGRGGKHGSKRCRRKVLEEY